MGVGKVKKRDGRLAEFEKDKIVNAIFKAAKSVGGEDLELAKSLAEKVIQLIDENFVKDVPTVEQIQDIVEKVLIENGHAATAKAYIIYRKEREESRKAKEMLGVRDELKLPLNTIKVLKARYLIKDEEGNVIESTSEMFRRVSMHLALVEILYHDHVFDRSKEQTIKDLPELDGLPKKAAELGLNINNVKMLQRAYQRLNQRKQMKVSFSELLEILKNKWSEIQAKEEEFYVMISSFEFMPNSPTLMNSGAPLGQLSACFVLPVGDSLDTIFDALKYTAVIHQSGGGTGFSFSKLRPNGDVVKSTKGIASGPLSFMRVFDVATDVIKQGGCISADSLIRTDKGVVPIAKLLNCPSFGSNPTNHLVYTNGDFERAFLAEDNGVAEVYKIKTEIGTEIKATYNHQIRVVGSDGKFSWKEVQDIKNGDWVVHVLDGHIGHDAELPPKNIRQHFNANRLKIPKKMTPELAELLGIYMADGCTSTGGRIIFSVEKNDIHLMKMIEELMSKVFGLKLGIVQKKSGDNSVCLVFYSKDLCRLFKEFEWKKEKSLHAFIPSHVFQSSAESARSFLRGLFEGDGDIHADGYPRLYSASEKLVKDAQQLLFGLGIVSTIHSYKSKNRFGKNPIYHLNIIQERSVDEFANKIGFISERKNEKLASRRKEKAFEQFDIIPNQGSLLRELYKGPGRGCGKGRSKLGANRQLYRDLQHHLDAIESGSSRNLTRKRLKTLLEKHKGLRHPQLIKLADNSYFYSRISGITKERAYTMDIMVPAGEQFVANSILVHNKRRGANMGIMRIDHPDILDFITSKDSENRVLTNFNISVAVTDKFMKALENDAEYDLLNPRTSVPFKRLFARQVWEMITYQAWKTGDPGVIFIDEINKYNQTPHIGLIEATNPCVAENMLVPTEHGLIDMKTLADGHHTTLLVDRRTVGREDTDISPMLNAWKTGVKQTYKLITNSGYEMVATADHKIMTSRGWVPLSELKMGKDRVLIQAGAGMWNTNGKLPFEVKNEFTGKNGRKYNFNFPHKWSKGLGQILGWLIGDGWIRDGDENRRVGLSFGADDRQILEYLKPLINEMYGREIKEVKRKNGVIHLSYHGKEFVDFFKKLGVKAVKAGEKEVPSSIFTATEDAVSGFLQGIFSSDGTIGFQEKNKTAYIRLTSKSQKLLKQVQLLLLNFGIKSRLYDRSRKPRKTFRYTSKNGEERTYASDGVLFELNISRDNIPRFTKKIGFLCKKHCIKLAKIEKRSYYKDVFEDEVLEIKPNGTEAVYDLAEPQTHSFICNGIVVSNCGEQPLLPYESCNLGSINLSKMLKETKGSSDVDWDKLAKTTKASVQFLDNVIDANSYPIKQIEFMTHANRKIGLGVMGFADMLIKLGMRYDSEEALKLGEKIMKFVTDAGREMSVELGKNRGNFPNFTGSLWEKKAYKHMRNATVTTIAPTGTISIISDCSSGIEPLFAVAFVRKNVLSGDELVDVNKLFEKYAREKGFYSEELMHEISRSGSVEHIDAVPKTAKELFKTAHDIDYEWHIKMQAAFQKYTDNAVSKTINMRNDAGIKDVENAYTLAYKLKCKGVTIYRDMSKAVQVIHIGDDKRKKTKMVKTDEEKKELNESEEMCPVCKSKLFSAEGCYTCLSCGYSKCG
jgi:ribonucleoside-diphosphate reductase alpha chain